MTLRFSGNEPHADQTIEEVCGPCLAGVQTPSQASPGDYIEFIKQQIAAGVPKADAITRAANMLREKRGK
jgi:hypothetical protein